MEVIINISLMGMMFTIKWVTACRRVSAKLGAWYKLGTYRHYYLAFVCVSTFIIWNAMTSKVYAGLEILWIRSRFVVSQSSVAMYDVMPGTKLEGKSWKTCEQNEQLLLTSISLFYWQHLFMSTSHFMWTYNPHSIPMVGQGLLSPF